ncbi:MAG: MoaD/ThiS family protein [Actinobacteria bacterium]|nr:MoaD/ThiS family protein [Actinomycetota bacterium]
MPVTVTLASALAKYSGGQRHVTIEVDGDVTLAGVIDAIGARYPGVKDRTVDDQGAIRRHVNVFVGQENVRFTGGLDTPIPVGAEVAILPAVSGGAGPGEERCQLAAVVDEHRLA